ncbi:MULTISPECIES: WD40/YVTN/BNR-like repeat-containing protein [Clostridium]|uniref:WD40/YVTN/BNR-like repeat-containing protein n=1 Tax=Clostridium TaxID=1485 RepID=UPI00042663B4|nr:hypothetical protein [Clostridium cadaveris]MDU4952562.1 hypothetical protein [Clostridium sp.]MDY4950615.1 hypothetical protein [Clostridium cadaveris]UFH65401.1 hypothetical protein KQH81_02285 [Clostridium cadaveris]
MVKRRIIGLAAVVISAVYLIGCSYILDNKDDKINTDDNKHNISDTEKESEKTPEKLEILNIDKGYKIEGEDVYVTYDNGINFVKVPVPLSSLKAMASAQEETKDLLEGSYFISQYNTAFIYGDSIVYASDDKGKSWRTSQLLSNCEGGPSSIGFELRRQFIGYTEDGLGYAIIAGDRAMNFENIHIYTSSDNGDCWKYKGVLNGGGTSFATGISFGNKNIGFITTKANKDNIYMTKNGGTSWELLKLPIPEELKSSYTTPNVPKFSGKHGEMYIGQGTNEDNLSNEKNKYIKLVSENYGQTWKYNGEISK